MPEYRHNTDLSTTEGGRDGELVHPVGRNGVPTPETVYQEVRGTLGIPRSVKGVGGLIVCYGYWSGRVKEGGVGVLRGRVTRSEGIPEVSTPSPPLPDLLPSELSSHLSSPPPLLPEVVGASSSL